MICRRCGKPKEPFLFTPGEIESGRNVCRKCQAERGGHEFGKTINIKQGFAKVRYVQNLENERISEIDEIRKKERAAEIERLKVQREDRIRKMGGTNVRNN